MSKLRSAIARFLRWTAGLFAPCQTCAALNRACSALVNDAARLAAKVDRLRSERDEVAQALAVCRRELANTPTATHCRKTEPGP